MTNEIRFVEIVEAIALQRDQIKRYGGAYVYQDRIDMAGAYLFHLAKNYAFVDGNKRVALAVMLYFLDCNGMKLDASHGDAERFVLDVASGLMTKDQAAVR